ncbi:hypothetical protein ACJVC5_00045 [Peredibacter sp. HCB2-198]|uniref:hypothetical protein n=1 Tax=Peredibacter sp. HCB2-198 TaxID=3383025 RepID=UPI0038B5A5C7
MLMKILFITFILMCVGAVSLPIKADDSLKQKAEEVGNDVKRGSKNATRKVKDETCELVHGKMECAGQKTKHSIQKGADKVEDAID